MINPNHPDLTTADTLPSRESNGHVAVGLDAAGIATLRFSAGVAPLLTVAGDATMHDLMRAQFERPTPLVHIEHSTVTIRYPRFPLSLFQWKEHPAEILLNTRVPWNVEIARGATHMTADLQLLRLASLSITGGLSSVVVLLPRPVGTVPIRLDGGVSDLIVWRPRGVGTRVDIADAASRIAMDDLALEAVSGAVHWRSHDYGDATNRYDISITGGAHNVAVDTY